MKDNPYMTLAKFILPGEMTEYFDLTKVESDRFGEEHRLHLYLDEKYLKPEGTPDAIPNGFYEESCINDFPIREYRTVLHVRRRRWTDPEGHNVSTDWDNMVQEHSRLSPDFVTFLKEIRRELSTDRALLREVLLYKR